MSHRQESIKSLVSGRAYVFIDAANILYSQQTLGWRVDYEKLRDVLSSQCEAIGEMFFYTGLVGENSKQQAFLRRLGYLGYRVRAKEVKRIKTGRNSFQWKGNLDIELAIDVLQHINQFDTMILMSGDSDFAPLVDQVKAAGRRVIVISTKGHVARELLQRAKYVNLKKLRSQLEYKKNPPARRAGRGLTSS